MLTVRIQEKNHSESIMVLKLKDGSCTVNSRNFRAGTKVVPWKKIMCILGVVYIMQNPLTICQMTQYNNLEHDKN